MGILSAAISPKCDSVVVGCGDGTISIMSLPKLQVLKKAKIDGNVTSITFLNDTEFAAGTAFSNIYNVKMEEFKPVLKSTCHYSKINDVCFPMYINLNFRDSSDVFATASDTDVRIWNAKTCTELLRIALPNLECSCITFKKDGSSLLTGWNDGKIRAFGPQSGRLQYEINDAHKKNVTALAVSDPYNKEGDFRIISGGEGIKRVTQMDKFVSGRLLDNYSILKLQ